MLLLVSLFVVVLIFCMIVLVLYLKDFKKLWSLLYFVFVDIFLLCVLFIFLNKKLLDCVYVCKGKKVNN